MVPEIYKPKYSQPIRLQHFDISRRINQKSLMRIFLGGQIKKGCDHSFNKTLKLAVSQGKIDGIN